MSNTLSLANRLRSISDDRLVEVIAARALSTAGIHDFFDLAESFLGAASVHQALSRLDRHTLVILAAIAELADTRPDDRELPTVEDVATRLATLAGSAPALDAITERIEHASSLLLMETVSSRLILYDTVAEQLTSWPNNGLPGLAELASDAHPPDTGTIRVRDQKSIERLAAERAFAATTAATELLIEIEREPARQLAKGGIALSDAKRLAAAMTVELDAVPTFLRLIARASLVAHEAGSWMTTDEGETWLLESSGQRWLTLATAWAQQLPEDIRGVLAAHRHSPWDASLHDHIDWLYPAGSPWMIDRVSSCVQDAEVVGIVANHLPSAAGRLLFDGDLSSAKDAMAALFPAEVERVYLQRDLTVVAPGPLTPTVDAQLRLVADVESRALASSYRISTASVNRALAAGETAESLLGFLSGISLTGIPQPLDYLINEAADRYGLLRVGRLHPAEKASDQAVEGACSYLRSDDDGLLSAVLVDQNLSALELTSIGDSMATSRFEADIVFWSLSDARYPVAAEDKAGQPLALHRRRTAKPLLIAASDPIRELVNLLRLSIEVGPEEAGHAWLVRQLDVAIRNKLALTVSVTLPDGSATEYQLEPASVSGGRLRSRDRRSAIERTLPLASISGLRPAE